MTVTIDPLYEPIRDTANLLSVLVRDRARYSRAPKSDPLIARYYALKPDILAITDPHTVESQLKQKVAKKIGWRPTKAENAAMKAGTYVYVDDPEVVVPHPDGAALLQALRALLADFPAYVRADPQYADRFAALKAYKP